MKRAGLSPTRSARASKTQRVCGRVLIILLTASPLQIHAQTVPPPQTRAPVRVCAGGDVTLGTNLDTTWAANASARYGMRFEPFPDPDSLLYPLRGMLVNADIILLNAEGAIGNGPSKSKCNKDSHFCFAFRQPPAAADALSRLGGNARIIANVANNHSRDAGEAGFWTTIRLLRNAGVSVTGSDTLATPVVTANGDTVAFLGFHTSRDTPDARDLAAVSRHVARAAARWPRLVVTAHIGAEGTGAQRTRNAVEMFLGMNRGNPVAFARTAIAAGADVVVAHGPHVVRGGEWYGTGLILYSLGNLLTYGPFRITEPMNRGVIACFSLDETGRPSNAQLIPTWQKIPGSVAIDPTGVALTLIDSLSLLDFPNGGLTVDSAGNIGNRLFHTSRGTTVTGPGETRIVIGSHQSGPTSASRRTPIHGLMPRLGGRSKRDSTTR